MNYFLSSQNTCQETVQKILARGLRLLILSSAEIDLNFKKVEIFIILCDFASLFWSLHLSLSFSVGVIKHVAEL